MLTNQFMCKTDMYVDQFRTKLAYAHAYVKGDSDWSVQALSVSFAHVILAVGLSRDVTHHTPGV